MDELVQLVSSKVGLPEDKARQAVNVVLDQLKQHLPEPIADQLNKLQQGDKGLQELSDLQGLLKGGGLGGLLGKK